MSQEDRQSAQAGAASAWQRWSFLVYLLFFLSGLTSLIYEVIWVRKFGLVFGVTTYAVSTVLAAFFAGLALGSYLAGRIIDRTRLHPLAVYGGMEGVVGVYALLLPLFLRLIESSYPAVYSRIGESFAFFTLFRFVVCFAVLVVPTTLMGATLPVLSKLMVDREAVLGLNVGRLYAVNTFGAVCGVASSGFYLIPSFGLPRTTLIAALGNFVLAAVAISMSRASAFAQAPAAQAPPAAEPEAPPLRAEDRLILLLAFTSGLCVLALEVVWTRSIILILGASTYAFSTMLTAVLVGIAAGSAVFSGYADRSRSPAAVVSALLFAGGLAAVLGPALINRSPHLFLQLYDWTRQVWSLVIVTQFVVCFLLVFIPTFLSGASFPILVRMYSRGAGRVGRTVADIYAINTIGGILGSLVGGFVMIGSFGLQPSLTAAALVLMAIGGPGAVLIARGSSRRLRTGLAGTMAAAVVVLLFFHPRFDTKLLFAGWGPFGGGYYASRMGGALVHVTDRYMQRLLYHKEGIASSVDVHEDGWGDLVITIDAKPMATTYLYDMRLLQMVGHLPALLHPDPREAVVIGLGAGVSSGALAIYPDVERLAIIELSPDVSGGARKFARWNHSVLDNDKAELIVNDGANYLKATKRRFDVISSDPFDPFVSGAATLYSHEHWEACKEHLTEGGIISQYLPLYHLTARDFATVVGTFVDVFPNATMWFCGVDTVLIGSKGPLKVDLERMAQRMGSDPVVAEQLRAMGVRRPADVLGWYVAGAPQLKEMARNAPRNHVEFPILEYNAPKGIRLAGIASTVSLLLTAVEQLSDREAQRQLNELSLRPLDEETFEQIAVNRQAGRWNMRAQMLSSYAYYDQALEACRQAVGLRPQDRFLQQALADALTFTADQQQADGDSEAAYWSCREAFATDPANTRALTGAVFAALQMGDLDLAEQTLSLASPAQRDIFQVKIYAGLIALHRREYVAAEQLFAEAEALRQESPTMHAALGVLHLRAGKGKQAYRRFDRAMAISTIPSDTLHDIVDMSLAHAPGADIRPYAEALLAAADGAVAQDPGNPQCYEYRALAYSAVGDQVGAEQDRTTARSLRGWWGESSTGWSEPALPPAE